MIIGSYKGTAAMGSIGVKRLQGYYRVLYVLTRMVLQARNVQSRAQQTEALQLKKQARELWNLRPHRRYKQWQLHIQLQVSGFRVEGLYTETHLSPKPLPQSRRSPLSFEALL